MIKILNWNKHILGLQSEVAKMILSDYIYVYIFGRSAKYFSEKDQAWQVILPDVPYVIGNPNYITPNDTSNTLNYNFLADMAKCMVGFIGSSAVYCKGKTTVGGGWLFRNAGARNAWGALGRRSELSCLLPGKFIKSFPIFLSGLANDLFR
jgi:hypothetical protein